MKRPMVSFLTFLGVFGVAQKFSVETSPVYMYSGSGVQLAVVAKDLAPGLPLAVRFGLSVENRDALDDSYDFGGGITWEKVKKENNLAEWGENNTLSLDVLFDLSLQELSGSLTPYLGLRYSIFRGGAYNATLSEEYSSNTFGLGGGFMVSFHPNPNLGIEADLGVDYYFQSCIVFSSGGSSSATCPGDTGYARLNAFVNQPEGFEFKVRLSLSLSL